MERYLLWEIDGTSLLDEAREIIEEFIIDGSEDGARVVVEQLFGLTLYGEEPSSEAYFLLQRLPGTYIRKPGSQLFYFLRVLGAEFSTIREMLMNMQKSRDIDTAYGRNLDFLGDNLKTPRLGLKDHLYRGQLKAAIASRFSWGSVDSIKSTVASMLNITADMIRVTPFWVQGEPAAIEIAAPLTVLARYGFTPTRWAETMQTVSAAGVRAKTLLRGTFSFASGDALEYDQEHGLADTDQAIGGTLGGYYDYDEEGMYVKTMGV